MNVGVLIVEVNDGGIERVLMLFFERIEIAHCRAAFDRAGCGDGAGFVEQRFSEARFAGARVAYEGNGPECFSAVLGHGLSSEILWVGQVISSCRDDVLGY